MKGYERSKRKLNDTRPGDKHEREKKEVSDGKMEEVWSDIYRLMLTLLTLILNSPDSSTILFLFYFTIIVFTPFNQF